MLNLKLYIDFLGSLTITINIEKWKLRSGVLYGEYIYFTNIKKIIVFSNVQFHDWRRGKMEVACDSSKIVRI